MFLLIHPFREEMAGYGHALEDFVARAGGYRDRGCLMPSWSTDAKNISPPSARRSRNYSPTRRLFSAMIDGEEA